MSSPVNPEHAWHFPTQPRTDWARRVMKDFEACLPALQDLNARCHQPFFAGAAGLSSLGVVSISAGSSSVHEGVDEALGARPGLGVVSTSSLTGPNRSCSELLCNGASEVGALGG